MRAAPTAAICCVLAVSAASPGLASDQAGELPLSTREYVTASIQANRFEVVEGELAASNGESAEVRRFGERMVREHGDAARDLAAAAAAAGLAPEKPTLSGGQAELLAALELKSGTAFDTEYLKQQRSAHQIALAIQGDYAAHGAAPPLRVLAGRTVAMVQDHLAALRRMGGM